MLLILLLEFTPPTQNTRENCVMCAGKEGREDQSILVSLFFLDVLVLFNLSCCANLVKSKAF